MTKTPHPSTNKSHNLPTSKVHSHPTSKVHSHPTSKSPQPHHIPNAQKYSEHEQILQNIPNILPFNIFLKSVLKKNRLSRLFDLEISIFYCNFATNLLTHWITMSKDTLTHQLTETIEELSCPESLKGLFHQHRDGNPLPSGKALEEIISLSRSILFPGYFGNSSVNISTIKYHIGVRVEKLYEKLSEQILAGLCFANDCEHETPAADS